jgi:hypothetical protein
MLGRVALHDRFRPKQLTFQSDYKIMAVYPGLVSLRPAPHIILQIHRLGLTKEMTRKEFQWFSLGE